MYLREGKTGGSKEMSSNTNVNSVVYIAGSVPKESEPWRVCILEEAFTTQGSSGGELEQGH